MIETIIQGGTNRVIELVMIRKGIGKVNIIDRWDATGGLNTMYELEVEVDRESITLNALQYHDGSLFIELDCLWKSGEHWETATLHEDYTELVEEHVHNMLFPYKKSNPGLECTLFPDY